MNTLFFNKKKAFTFVELVLVMLVIGIFSFSVFMFIDFSSGMQSKQTNEVEFQENMRDSMLTIEEKIKKSNSVFAIPQKDFLGVDGKPLDRHWIYIGVADKGENTGQVCMFECENPDASDPPVWKETVLSSDKEQMKYEMAFKKAGEKGVSQKKLNYSITGTSESGIKRTLNSSTEVLNVLAVVDRGTEAEPARVIAIRNGKVIANKVPTLTFVVDVSDSMFQKFGEVTRMEKTREVIKKMVDSINYEGFPVDVTFVDFGSFANVIPFENKKALGNTYYGNIINDYDDIVDIISQIDPTSNQVYNPPWNKKISTRTVAGRTGGTNIGDALKIAFETIKKSMASNPKEEKSRYLILMSDGEPTSLLGKKANKYDYDFKLAYSVPFGVKYTYYKYYVDDKEFGEAKKDGVKEVNRNTSPGGDNTKTPGGHKLNVYHEFPKMMARKYRCANPGAVPPVTAGSDAIQGLKPYIISVAVEPEAKDFFVSLNENMGNPATSYYKADNEADLEAAIRSITSEFLADAWSYNGPIKSSE